MYCNVVFSICIVFSNSHLDSSVHFNGAEGEGSADTLTYGIIH